MTHMTLKLGDRVKTPKGIEGTVKYVGKVPYAKGTHVGVALDTAAGDHNGKKRGKRYFSCKRKHGIIQPPTYFQKLYTNPLYMVLVEGYIREIQHDIQQTIPSSIITLCFNFFLYFAQNWRGVKKRRIRCSTKAAMHPPKQNKKQYPNSFIWNISDAVIMEKMKSCIPGEHWDSKYFSTSSNWSYLNHLKWFLRLHPNGQNQEHGGDVKLSIRLLTLSLFIKSIQFKCKMSFLEGNMIFEHSHNAFSIENTESHWKHGILSTKDLQQYNKWTFKVEIEICDVSYDPSQFQHKSTQTDEANYQDQQLKNTELDSIVMQNEQINSRMDKATQTD